MKVNSRFRPQHLPSSFIFKHRLKHTSAANWNWQSRIHWYPAGWQVNHISIARRFHQLHYLACHAPEPVQRRWKVAYQRFCVKHFATFRASVRYINNYSCHSWL